VFVLGRVDEASALAPQANAECDCERLAHHKVLLAQFFSTVDDTGTVPANTTSKPGAMFSIHFASPDLSIAPGISMSLKTTLPSSLDEFRCVVTC